MNKTLITSIIVIILIALGVWYFSSKSTSTNYMGDTATSTVGTGYNSTPTASGTTGTTATGGTTTGSSTFRSIFTQAGNHQCTYEQVGTGTRSSSLIDISGGQMRGEFRTTTGAASSANLMIYNGGSLYTWKEGATVGTKTSIKTLADLPAVIPADLTSGAIYGVSSDNVSWDCHDWIKDASVFVIPSYVKFTAAS